MKGNELRDSQLPPVSPLDPVVERQAALNVAYRLERLPLATKKREVLELLQALGLAPYEPAHDARVDPTTGQTLRAPSAESKAKAAARKREWRLGRNEEAS